MVVTAEQESMKHSALSAIGAALLLCACAQSQSAGAPRIVALVPAHNEESDIGRTLDGLLSQTRPIDRIVVILDNCTDGTDGTDGTEAVVRRYKGVTVQKTFGNIDEKVGALTPRDGSAGPPATTSCSAWTATPCWPRMRSSNSRPR